MRAARAESAACACGCAQCADAAVVDLIQIKLCRDLSRVLPDRRRLCSFRLA
jgi:hypothetical protein